jgi:hypothetical protein
MYRSLLGILGVLGLHCTPVCNVISITYYPNLKIKSAAKPECGQNLNFYQLAQYATDVGEAGLLPIHY